MAIFRSNDPTTFDDVDQIVIDERAPSPAIRGVASNVAGYVGDFERGPEEIVEVGSTQQFEEIFGKTNRSGNLNLKNKRYGRLKIRRAVAVDAALATLDLDDSGAAAVLTVNAKSKGAYGNNITVTVETGTETGLKYTFKDTNSTSILSDEVFDNVSVASKDQTEVDAIFASSLMVDVLVQSPVSANEPVVIAATNLATGSDGTLADTAYENAIDDFAAPKSANVLFLDSYNAARRNKLELHAAATQDKMVILAGAENDDKDAVISDVANHRDSDGRIIYAYPWVQTLIGSSLTFQSPASWYAAVISQTAPNIDPASSVNTQFLGGIIKLKRTLSNSDYIQLKDAGVSAFEIDPDIGPKVKSGVVTQISNSSKTQVLRRRMADFLTNSAGFFLKNYQNAVNNRRNRLAIGAAIRDFVTRSERDGLLPSDEEVSGGKAKLIDVETLNTDQSIALGFFKVLWKQRIFSSMRFIVLQAEIGQSVVVTEGE